MPDHPFSQEIIPNIQSKPSLVHLVADSSHPATCCLREETDPQWSAFASELHVAECCGETGIHQPTLISMKLCPFNLGESVVTLLLFSLAWSEYNFLWVFLVSLDAVNALLRCFSDAKIKNGDSPHHCIQEGKSPVPLQYLELVVHWWT